MATMSAKDRNRLPDSAFGIPSKRAYPLYKLDGDKLVPDKTHIESAVKLFGHASRDDKPLLAKNILRAAHEAGMDTSGWNEVNKWANHEGVAKKNAAEKAVAESAMSFDIAMTIADIVLEYNEILYDEFYDAVYADDETFMEQFEEPDDVQEAVPGLWEDYLRQHMPGYDPKTHTLPNNQTVIRNRQTGEETDLLDADLDMLSDDENYATVQYKRRKSPTFPRGTSKEMNRRNAFLKAHKFDPKTGTIEIDELDPRTGQKMRIPVQFALGTRRDGDMSTSFAQQGWSNAIPHVAQQYRMQLGGTDLAQKKREITEPTFGHEIGHIHQYNATVRAARQYPHLRQLDDIVQAAYSAKAKGDEDGYRRYNDLAGQYMNTHRKKLSVERAALEGRASEFSRDSTDSTEANFRDRRYQRAYDDASDTGDYAKYLNDHDIRPDELHADDYGAQLARQYTRGRNTSPESLRTLESPEDKQRAVLSAKKKVLDGQNRRIRKTSSPMSRYHDAIDEISKNRKIQRLEYYKTLVKDPEDGDDIEAAKAKLAELESDPEVQELLAKRKALREEYRQVPSDKRQYVDRTEYVPAPDPAYAGIDVCTISDDDLLRRINPKALSNQTRIEIARKNRAEDAARELSDQQYRRKLSRDALQTQLDSGKLTPQQEKKARQKIASIDAFERKAQSAVDGTPITTKPKKKKSTSTTKTEPKKTTTPTKQESSKKPEETKKKESSPKKDEIEVPTEAKKDSMTVNDQKEPKK